MKSQPEFRYKGYRMILHPRGYWVISKDGSLVDTLDGKHSLTDLQAFVNSRLFPDGHHDNRSVIGYLSHCRNDHNRRPGDQIACVLSSSRLDKAL